MGAEMRKTVRKRLFRVPQVKTQSFTMTNFLDLRIIAERGMNDE